VNNKFNNVFREDKSVVDFTNISDDEVYTKVNKSYTRKKVKNAIPGSKQDRINSLTNELPTSTNGIEKNDIGRGTDASIPDSTEIVLQ
jgi:hypothetical protein